MPTIMISIMPDGIPVDKMDGDNDGPSCPSATLAAHRLLKMARSTMRTVCPQRNKRLIVIHRQTVALN